MKHAVFLRDRGCVLICCRYIAVSFSKNPNIQYQIPGQFCVFEWFDIMVYVCTTSRMLQKEVYTNFWFFLTKSFLLLLLMNLLKSQGFCSKVTKLFVNHTKNWAELWDHHYKWWISSTSLLVAISQQIVASQQTHENL